MAFKKTAVPGQRYIPKQDNPELRIQRAVCHYLKTKHPNVYFESDVMSDLPLEYEDKKRIVGRIKALNSNDARPDMKIFARSWDGKYSGLALELKADGATVILKIGPDKGKLSTDEHIRAQAKTLRKLNAEGWYANFAIGYDQAIRYIEWYFGTQRFDF